MQRGLIILLSVFSLSACTMSETRIYSLYMPDPTSPPLSKGGNFVSPPLGKGDIGRFSDASIAIHVSSPRYLAQPYIAYRNSPYQLSISRYSRWDSSPSDMVKEAFKDSLSSMGLFKAVRVSSIIPRGFYSLQIGLRRFERFDVGNDSSGELVFDVDLLSPDGKEMYRSTVSKKIKLDDRGFLSLAKGLSIALKEGIGEAGIGIGRVISKEQPFR